MEMALLKCFSWYIGGVCYVSKEWVICKMRNRGSSIDADVLPPFEVFYLGALLYTVSNV